MLSFAWDEDKANFNIEKHGISFETAALVFDEANYIKMYDFEHSTSLADQ